MLDLDFRDQMSESLPKSLPCPAASLAPPAKLPPPHVQHFVPKRLHSVLVPRYRVVLEIAANHRLEPLPRALRLLVQALPQLLPNLLQLGRHALADRLPVHLEVPRLMILPTNVSETQKIKGFRLPFPTLLPPLSGIAPEFHQARLLWMQLQPELPHPLPQFLQELLGFFPVLKPKHRVVRVPHHDHLAARHLLPPCLHPQIEHIMQVEIGKHWRNHRPLRSPFLRLEPLPILYHARSQPFQDQADEPFIADPMPHELFQMAMLDFVEK